MKKFNKNSAIRKINLQQNKNTYIKRLSISLSCLILLICIILFTFAKFNTSSDNYTLINGKLGQYPINVCEYDIGKTWTFNYNGSNGSDGSVQSFNVPCNGEYKLEVWGAQGGHNEEESSIKPGYGGYSIGVSKLKAKNNIYVVVGGKGKNSNGTESQKVTNGGYNGGGNGLRNGVHYEAFGAGGGGATHIATVTGQLNTLESHKGTLVNNSYYSSNKILIVAGGGGGDAKGNLKSDGGSGGGFDGVYGKNMGPDENNPNTAYNVHGGHQTTGGCYNTECYWANQTSVGTFGKGGATYTEYDSDWGSGGGGGFYGGAASFYGGSAGGSGYIASSNLKSSNGITKHMSCYECSTSNNAELKTETTTCHNNTPTANCAKEGHGYAKITLLSTPDRIKITLHPNGGILSENEIIRSQNFSIREIPTPKRPGYAFRGWYSDQSFTNLVNENTIVTTQLFNLYAKWELTNLYELTNFVSNGSFENDGITVNDGGNWRNYDPTTLTVTTSTNQHKDGSRSLKINFLSNYQLWLLNHMKGISVPINHKIYARASAYIETGNLSLGISIRNEATDTNWEATYDDYGSIAYNPSHNWEYSIGQSWQDYSVYFNANYSYFMFMLCEAFENTAGSVLYFDNVLLVDLTEAFGAGNEPSKEWCDQNLNYFDGTTTLYKP